MTARSSYHDITVVSLTALHDEVVEVIKQWQRDCLSSSFVSGRIHVTNFPYHQDAFFNLESENGVSNFSFGSTRTSRTD